MYVLGAKKNRLIETFLLSTHNIYENETVLLSLHNICFGLRNKKNNFYYWTMELMLILSFWTIP